MVSKLPEPDPEHGRADETVTFDQEEWTVPDHEMHNDDWTEDEES